jgi:hypothetical protein
LVLFVEAVAVAVADVEFAAVGIDEDVART